VKVLITGGGGFIGYHLARYHLTLGDSVTIVDNLLKTDGELDEECRVLVKTPLVELLQIDLTDAAARRMPLSNVDIVYHLAAINGTRFFYEIPYGVARANLLMTLNLLDALEGKSIGKLVFASSSEVYAGCGQVGLLKIPTDEDIPVVFPQPTEDRFCYGGSKFMGEFLCLRFGRQLKVPTSIVRYHNVYGPRMGKMHVIPEFIARILARENPFRIYGGQETRAFCYVEDAVEAT
jgi:UDP-glucose 4-epimerase/UDP-glucuronate decarboxylase